MISRSAVMDEEVTLRHCSRLPHLHTQPRMQIRASFLRLIGRRPSRSETKQKGEEPETPPKKTKEKRNTITNRLFLSFSIPPPKRIQFQKLKRSSQPSGRNGVTRQLSSAVIGGWNKQLKSRVLPSFTEFFFPRFHFPETPFEQITIQTEIFVPEK